MFCPIKICSFIFKMCTSTIENQQNRSKRNKQSILKLMMELLRCLIIQIHFLFDCVVDFLFGLYYDNSAKKVPPVTNDLLLESATSLAKKIREKKVSAETVVRAFIDRCKQVNGMLNAVVEDRYEDAIKEAKQVDEVLKSSNVDLENLAECVPFFGVPFTTKESNEAEGMLHTMGAICRKGHRSKRDAEAIGHVKKAGAILIAKTNIPELNQWVESRNNVYGQTNNPYNTTRTVGGSSGGDSAIVTACGAPFAVGSDIGGSVRIPALCNGVFGFKPSEGMTSLKGIGMRYEDYFDSMAEVGPICKRAEDIEPLLKVISGPKLSQRLVSSSTVDIKKIKIFYQERSTDLRASKLSSAAHSAVVKAVSHLSQITGSATEVHLPGSQYSYRLWRFGMTKESCDFKSDITNNKGYAYASTEIVKFLTGNSNLTLAAVMKLIDLDLFPCEKEEWATNQIAKMKQYLLEKLGNDGILIYPSLNAANYHYASFLRPFNFGVMGIFNALKVPVCQVPIGLDDDGLPVGIQVVANPNNDHLCFAVAKELEEIFGGWIPPS